LPSLITPTSGHDRVRLRVFLDGEHGITSVQAFSNEATDPPTVSVDIPLTQGRLIDTTSDDFEACVDKIEAGNMEVLYSYADSLWLGKDSVPTTKYELFRIFDEFETALQTRSALDAIGPKQVIYFKRVAGDDEVDAPSLGTFEYDVTSVDSIMTAAGWSTSAPTGSDPLYSTVVTWSVTEGVSTATATAPQTDAIQFSTDGGATWLNSPPSDYSTVNAIQHYVAGTGWIVDPTTDDTTDPVALIHGDNWLNASGHKLINMSTEDLDDSYILGFDIQVTESWGDTNTLRNRGNVEIPMKLIKNLSANDYRSDTDFYDGCTYKLIMDERNGSLSLGIADDDTIAYTGYDSALVAFVTYPQGTLHEDLDLAETSIRLSSNIGMAVGAILYMDEEQMEVTGTYNVERMHVIDGETVSYWNFDVTRGVNGTTIQTHSIGDSWRAIVNREVIRYVVVMESNFPSNTRGRLYRVKKRKD